MSFTLRELEYLVAVADHGHFGRAAEACAVTQPTLSTQLRKLEHNLQISLIDRATRQVRLTSVGETIVAQARKILYERQVLLQLALHNLDPLGGEFRLGVIPTVAPYLLPRALPDIRSELPNLHLSLMEAQTEVIVSKLQSGLLDAGVLAFPVDEPSLTGVSLYSESFLFALHVNHPKSIQRFISLGELENEDVLLLDEGHCLREQALEICKSHRALTNMNFRASSLETLRQMVAANMGVTLMPRLAAKPTEFVKYLPFENAEPHREIGLFWHEASPRTELLVRVAENLSLEETV